MEFVELAEEQRRFFDENGYIVVPDVLSSEEVEQLAQASDRIVKSCNSDGPYVQIRPGIVEEPAFHPLLACSPTIPLLVQLLSPNIHLHTTAIIYKSPQITDDEETIRQRGWHRDIGITEDLGHNNLIRAGIKVGYCLTDFHQPHSGFTMFAEGSHLEKTPLQIPAGEVDPINAVDLCLNAGDAFLFENRIFHTSAPNLSNRTSKVIIFGYSYRWMGGRKDQMQCVQPDETVLDQVDDIRRQLLGGSSDALSHWAQEQGIAPEPIKWTMVI